MMISPGCPCESKNIGIDAALLRDSYLYSKATRAVYTISQLVWDLGLTEKLYHVNRVIDELQARFDGGNHIIYVNGTYKSVIAKILESTETSVNEWLRK